MANVTKDYSPENMRTFSEQGKEEIARLVKTLGRRDFDHIIVSPTHRTLQTVLPYLRATRQSAEIWPEVEECCFQSDRGATPPAALAPGHEIELAEPLAPFFRFRSAEANRWYNAKHYAHSEEMALRAADLVTQRFGGSGKTVLIVTHYHTGAWMISRWLDDEAARKFVLETSKLNHIRQHRDGRFELIALNGKPVEDDD